MDAEFDWLTLDADEEVVWSETPHSYSLVPAIVVGVLLAVVLVGVVILVGAYLSHRNTNYVVTTDALYKKTGVLSRNVQRIEFDKVQDTSYRQSFLGAHFGYGTVDVSTAGGGGVEMSFSNVAEPLSVQTLINERLRATGVRSGDEGRDADELLAVILDELRAIRSAVENGSAGLASSADPDDPGLSTVRDPTGRLSDEGEASELAADPSDSGTAPDGDGPNTQQDSDAFRFEERR